MATWHRKDQSDGDTIYYADREDGTEMDVTLHGDGSVTIFVYAPDGESEYLVGEIENITVNEAIERAESVNLPDEDTGM